MAASRKSEREQTRLADEGRELWDDQKEVLDHAARILREAGRRAGQYSQDDLSARVRPVLSATRRAAASTRGHLSDDVLPAVSSAFGSALAILEAARDPKVRAALRRSGVTGKASAVAEIVPQKQSNGIGRYILIGVGLVAAAGIAYAAWQTLRADDDLWIDDEDFTEQSGEIQPS